MQALMSMRRLLSRTVTAQLEVVALRHNQKKLMNSTDLVGVAELKSTTSSKES